MNLPTGLLLVGKCLGFKQVDGKSRQTNEAYTMHYLGVEMPKEGGFPGETVVHEIMIPKDLIHAGIMGTITSLVDKQVSASIYVRTFSGRNGAGYSFNLTNSLDAIKSLALAPASSTSKAA